MGMGMGMGMRMGVFEAKGYNLFTSSTSPQCLLTSAHIIIPEGKRLRHALSIKVTQIGGADVLW